MPTLASPSRYLTPPQVAERYGVDSAKVICWIRNGEIRAVDVSTSTGGRPRYRINPVDLALFEASRAAGPQPRVTRRRRKDPSVTEFF